MKVINTKCPIVSYFLIYRTVSPLTPINTRKQVSDRSILQDTYRTVTGHLQDSYYIKESFKHSYIVEYIDLCIILYKDIVSKGLAGVRQKFTGRKFSLIKNKVSDDCPTTVRRFELTGHLEKIQTVSNEEVTIKTSRNCPIVR